MRSPGADDSQLVVGVGGSGRTFQLRAWATALGCASFGGSHRDAALTASPLAPITANDVADAMEKSPQVLLADDLQWFAPDAIMAVVEASKSVAVLASRRPRNGIEQSLDILDLATETLGRRQPITRLDRWDFDSFPARVAQIRQAAGDTSGRSASTEVLSSLWEATGGLAALAADCVASSWTGDLASLPASLVDSVSSRIRRAGPGAAELVNLWALAAPAEPPPGLIEDLAVRVAQAGGLLKADHAPVPLVVAAAQADIGPQARAKGLTRLATSVADSNKVLAARYLVAAGPLAPKAQLDSNSTATLLEILLTAARNVAVDNPREALEFVEHGERLGLPDKEGAAVRALVSFHQGSPDAISHLNTATHSGVDGASGPGDSQTQLLAYGVAFQELRFGDAAQIKLGGELGPPLSALASALIGNLKPSSTLTPHSPLARMPSATAAGVVAVANGDRAMAIGQFTAAADDFDRLGSTQPFGFTPHQIGALGAIFLGDLDAVGILGDLATTNNSGGQAHQLGQRIVGAFGKVLQGDYNDALTIGRETVPDLLPQSDRLVLAALESAIARRSGDTGRLRSAWRTGEAALLRHSVSWLHLDLLIELLAAGARLGFRRRVDPIVDGLVQMTSSLPPLGPGPVAGQWLRIQIALATENGKDVASAVKAIALLAPEDERSKARIAAARMWLSIVGPRWGAEADEAPIDTLVDEILATADRLAGVGDGWEASRLLGQAALDVNDSRAARHLLERARVSTTEKVEESSSGGLSSLGLSEREAEVAKLVTEGQRYKAIGAQLFISPKTVEHHVAKIRQKLGAKTRADMVAIVREALAKPS